ncbi:hypothetical protein T552_02410 [Pneumocystis carinii B80]|uniref:MADS-box domain-containing protein n=1 Tax=Pneumocystis carinii (strain B80) TaxID=1408658 RepID=A0A0W4ZGD1_PNEC8|nr:hypothetical protein T552_02410 [Pneumocystis carinii B80]KTW27432.1 hypothetical protein T552_02410 [Pneumocystis carinii B80]
MTQKRGVEEGEQLGGSVEEEGKRARMEDDDEDKVNRERRKIEIKFIEDKSRRHITFSKRKAGIMKKAYELSVLTGTQVLLLVVSETGLVYTFTTPKLQPLVTKAEGKNLIQACLNAQDSNTGIQDEAEPNLINGPTNIGTTNLQSYPPPPPSMRALYFNPDQAAVYQQYMQQPPYMQPGRMLTQPPPPQHHLPHLVPMGGHLPHHMNDVHIRVDK